MYVTIIYKLIPKYFLFISKLCLAIFSFHLSVLLVIQLVDKQENIGFADKIVIIVKL